MMRISRSSLLLFATVARHSAAWRCWCLPVRRSRRRVNIRLKLFPGRFISRRRAIRPRAHANWVTSFDFAHEGGAGRRITMCAKSS